jgi:hypothetical protein
MSSRTRRVRALAVPFVATMMIVLSGATTANAGDNPLPSGDVATSGRMIQVTVSGTGYKGGSTGSPGGGTVYVPVPVPCYWTGYQWPGNSVMTGKAYYELVKSGGRIGYDPAPWAGYEQYKDDEKGHWYVGECDGQKWPDPHDGEGFLKFAFEFFATHDHLYVPAGQTPPTPPLPPELLRDVAIKNLTLPDPLLDWNPKRAGNQGTLVNLDTWFWLDNSPTTLTVNAAAGGNQASVIVTFAGMDISAPGEAPLSCAGPGTPYTPAARVTTCALAFRWASSASGAQTTPVTVQTTWTGTWAANGVDQGPITPQPAPVTATANIRVDEVQTLVTGAR